MEQELDLTNCTLSAHQLLLGCTEEAAYVGVDFSMEILLIVVLSAVGGIALWTLVPYLLQFCCRQVLHLVGFATSTSGKAKPPNGITHVTPSLWEFYHPGELPQADIIFFHGLQLGDYKDAFWKTWLSEDGKVVWPREWLKETFPRARIFSASYDSCAVPSNGQIHLDGLGKNLVDDIIMREDLNIGHDCPIILVGHSLGGIIIKKFILTARYQSFTHVEETYKNRASKFLENLKGVFYYGTPHGGSKIADWIVRYISFANTGQMVALLKTLELDTANINAEFENYRTAGHRSERHLRTKVRIPTKGILASKKTSFKLAFLPFTMYRVKIVQEGAARIGLDDYHIAMNANHFQVCRPADQKIDAIYTQLRDFITRNVWGLHVITEESREDSLILP